MLGAWLLNVKWNKRGKHEVELHYMHLPSCDSEYVCHVFTLFSFMQTTKYKTHNLSQCMKYFKLDNVVNIFPK